MKIVECPRDAMQGLAGFIPTEKKVKYINQLLKVGYDTIDFGSFVSTKAIPQMRDTADVLSSLNLEGSQSKLLSIIANLRGAEQACSFSEITYLGFPLSISETFQQRNTNKSVGEAIAELELIQNSCIKYGKQLVVYFSMGFGNPYGDPFDNEMIEEFVQKMDQLEVRIISLSDTIGVANPENIQKIFSYIIHKFPYIEFGAHLHSNPNTALEKISSAYKSGCRRFDGAINGYGGCPMADDALVGNMATETIIGFCDANKIAHGLDQAQFVKAFRLAEEVFPKH